MFLKKDQTWYKYIPEYDVDKYNENLSEIKLHSKCVNANVYMSIQELGSKKTYTFENISVITDNIGQVVLYDVPKYVLPYLFTYGFEWKITIEGHSVPSMNQTFDLLFSSWAANLSNVDNYDYTLQGAVMPINLPAEPIKLIFERQEDAYRDLGWFPYGFNSLEDYHFSLKAHFTPVKAIERQLKNFKIVDLASTTNVAINTFIINPVIDGFTVKVGHKVLLKDQIDPTENGIYVYTLNKEFVRESDFDTLETSFRACYHIKIGKKNREKQFFLQRDASGAIFPVTGDDLFFEENHNYLLRHKLEYRNLAEAEFEDLDFTPNLPNPNTTYAVGEYGLYLIRTFVPFVGMTIEAKELGTRERLHSLFIGRDQLGNETGNVWICGRRGTMLHSDDFSATFSKQNPNTTQDLYDVEFVDDLFGMAVGSLGTIVWTDTGGSSWKNELSMLAEEQQKNLNAIKFYAANKAIVVGDRGLVFLLSYANNVWTTQLVDIIKIEDSVTAYKVKTDLMAVDYDNLTMTAYIVGSNKTVFTLNLDETSANYLDVFFYQTTSVTHANTRYNTCKWKANDLRLLIAGDSSIVYRIDPSAFTLLPNSNIYEITTDYDTTITPSFIGTTPPKNINAIQYYVPGAKNNYYYLAGDIGSWGEFRQVSAYNYAAFYNPGIFPSKLLVLDAKIADKMYFSDDNGLPVFANTLRHITLGQPVDYIDMSVPDATDTLTFYTSEKTFLDYQDYYAPVPHNRLFQTFDPTATTAYVYGSSGPGYFNITNWGNTQIQFNTNNTVLVLNDAIFSVAPGDNIRIYIIDYTNTLLFLDETFLVTAVSGSNVTIDAVFDDRFKNDLYNAVSPFRLTVTNLNYYPFTPVMTAQTVLNGLLSRLNQHTLGQFFEFKSVNPNMFSVGLGLTIKNVPWTKYINGKTNVDYYSGSSLATTPYLMDYEDSVNLFKYGHRHNLSDLLFSVDNLLFPPTKTFNMPQTTTLYEGSPLLPTQFVFNGHVLVMGSAYQNLYESYYVNTFVDIVHNGVNTLRTRSLLVDKYVTVESGVTRYHLVFDFNLQDYVFIYTIVTGDTIDIRSRNTLAEIGIDLRYADDRQLDYFYQPFDVVTSKAFHNILENFNTDSYARILAEDPDVRDVCCGILYTDSNFDLAFNLLKLDGDPNFNFHPVDIYDVGIDLKAKNAISLTRFNYEQLDVQGAGAHIGLKLQDIDFKKYNFRLVDGLTLQSLSQKYPWVLEAEIENAIIGEDARGLVWYAGDWICGTWKDGTWYSGRFFDGIWVTGLWYSREIQDRIFSVLVKSNTSLTYSQWFNGTWISGEWFNGTWFNGSWQSGTWNEGHWLDGTWYTGRWNNGTWKGGEWINGVWYNGKFNTDNVFSTWYNGFWYGGDFENGLWKNGEFNQLRRSISRFGTKSTAQQKSIWEHGVFIRGQFHSYLNEDENGNPLPSLLYRDSVWLSGHWKNGVVYGGTFKQGVWDTGVWKRGYVEGGLSLTPVSVVNTAPGIYRLTLTPNQSHKMQTGDLVYIVGTPDNLLPISTFMQLLGLNTVPQSHKIFKVESNGDIIIEFVLDPLDPPLLLTDVDGTNSGYIDLFSVFAVKDIQWFGGIFNNGLWLNGTWLNGMWADGIWDNGVWMDPNVPQP